MLFQQLQLGLGVPPSNQSGDGVSHDALTESDARLEGNSTAASNPSAREHSFARVLQKHHGRQQTTRPESGATASESAIANPSSFEQLDLATPSTKIADMSLPEHPGLPTELQQDGSVDEQSSRAATPQLPPSQVAVPPQYIPTQYFATIETPSQTLDSTVSLPGDSAPQDPLIQQQNSSLVPHKPDVGIHAKQFANRSDATAITTKPVENPKPRTPLRQQTLANLAPVESAVDELTPRTVEQQTTRVALQNSTHRDPAQQPSRADRLQFVSLASRNQPANLNVEAAKSTAELSVPQPQVADTIGTGTRGELDRQVIVDSTTVAESKLVPPNRASLPANQANALEKGVLDEISVSERTVSSPSQRAPDSSFRQSANKQQTQGGITSQSTTAAVSEVSGKQAASIQEPGRSQNAGSRILKQPIGTATETQAGEQPGISPAHAEGSSRKQHLAGAPSSKVEHQTGAGRDRARLALSLQTGKHALPSDPALQNSARTAVFEPNPGGGSDEPGLPPITDSRIKGISGSAADRSSAPQSERQHSRPGILTTASAYDSSTAVPKSGPATSSDFVSTPVAPPAASPSTLQSGIGVSDTTLLRQSDLLSQEIPRDVPLASQESSVQDLADGPELAVPVRVANSKVKGSDAQQDSLLEDADAGDGMPRLEVPSTPRPSAAVHGNASGTAAYAYLQSDNLESPLFEQLLGTVDASPEQVTQERTQAETQNPFAVTNEGMKSLQTAVQRPHASTTPNIHPDTAVAEQIGEPVRDFVRNGDDGTLTVELQPEELGHVKVTVRNAANGLSAQIWAAEAVTTELLITQQQELKDYLVGFGFDDVSVDVSHEENAHRGSHASQAGNISAGEPEKGQEESSPDVNPQDASRNGTVNILA